MGWAYRKCGEERNVYKDLIQKPKGTLLVS
jgi:hypothetical protein